MTIFIVAEEEDVKHCIEKRDKYANELTICFNIKGVVFKTSQAMVYLKVKFLEEVGTTDFQSDKQFKKHYSALRITFKESSEDIYIN